MGPAPVLVQGNRKEGNRKGCPYGGRMSPSTFGRCHPTRVFFVIGVRWVNGLCCGYMGGILWMNTGGICS